MNSISAGLTTGSPAGQPQMLGIGRCLTGSPRRPAAAGSIPGAAGRMTAGNFFLAFRQHLAVKGRRTNKEHFTQTGTRHETDS
jgi:hypothetical protein